MMNILRFTCHPIPFDEWLPVMADFMGVDMVDQTAWLPASVGNGYLKAMLVQPGLSFALADFTLATDLDVEFLESRENGFLLYFRKLIVNDPYVFSLQGQKKELEDESSESAFMLSTQMSHSLHFKKGTKMMALAIHLHKDWISQNINCCSKAKLEAYVAQGINNYNKEVLTAKHKHVLESMLGYKQDLPLGDLFLKSRAYRMTEYFLNSILSRTEKDFIPAVTEADIQQLKKVEQVLSINELIPFPSVDELAKLALMSSTKLKKLFKQIYGMGLYEYYQKNRMHLAREMLASNKYKISEIGVMLGYSNLSNFSIAFKKEFGCLPSEYKAAADLRA